MKRRLLPAAIMATIAALWFAVGSIHIVRGHKVRSWPGIPTCGTRGWTLRDTFINTDDYVGQPKLVAALDASVVLAICRCGLCYVPPKAWDVDLDII